MQKGIIGCSHYYGNNNVDGYHSSGFYDISKYQHLQRTLPDMNSGKIKMTSAHIGVIITSSGAIYIEDKYADMLD